MTHHIKTAYGDSDLTYHSDPSDPLQGGGHGNAAIPPIWVALSIIILKVLALFEPEAPIVAIFSSIIISFAAILYVDDTDVFFTKSEDE